MTNNLTKQQQEAVDTLCRDTKMSSAEAVQILMRKIFSNCIKSKFHVSYL